MNPAYVSKPVLQVRKTNGNAQKINSFFFNNYDIVITI